MRLGSRAERTELDQIVASTGRSLARCGAIVCRVAAEAATLRWVGASNRTSTTIGKEAAAES